MLLVTGSALACPFVPGCSFNSGGKGELNFYNYSNYIARNTIPDFEKEYKTRVNYDVYSNQDVLFAKIKIGVTGYDVVIATDLIVRRFLKQNLLLPLEPSKIPNIRNLMDRFQAPDYDPQHEYSIPYLWGTTVIAYNKKFVKSPEQSWTVLWQEQYKNRITLLDEKRDTIGSTLMMLGYSGNDTDRTHLAEARKKLLQQRPLVKKYTSDYQDLLITGESWLSQAWSGDVIQVRDVNPEIDFFIPREGSFIWVDNCCIPQGAPHPDLAREFINYILRPEVGAEIALSVGYPTPNKESFEIIRRKKPQIAADERIYPSGEIMKRLDFYKDIGEEERYWNGIWEDVKLGKE